MNLTDNEIIKALECCVQGYCRGCAFDDGANFNCKDNVMESVLNLINRQKAEIEKLSCQLEKCENDGEYWESKYNNLKKESTKYRTKSQRQKGELLRLNEAVKRLKKECNSWRDGYIDQKQKIMMLEQKINEKEICLKRILSTTSDMKSEAIKEFAERVKQEINFPLAVWSVFDNLVKEMMVEQELRIEE